MSENNPYVMEPYKPGLVHPAPANIGGNCACAMSGDGSPEGVVTADVGTTYTDISNPDVPKFWTKTSGTGNTGWQQLIN